MGWAENCSHEGVTEQINNHDENIGSEVSHNLQLRQEKRLEHVLRCLARIGI